MNETICVRDARAADRDFVVECNAAMASETEGRTLERAVLAGGVAAVFQEPRRGFYLVAERAGVRAGCLMITTEWSDWRNGDWWWVQSVYVIPGARRHGVFRALYVEAEHRARVAADVIGLRLYVERDNRAAQATYQRMGMHETPYRVYECGFGEA
ncbi:MAG: GNAT family N-acetyltransferase [Rhodanobacteraceae bacterium]